MRAPVRFRDGGFEYRCPSCREWWALTLESWDPRHGMQKCRACIAESAATWHAAWRGDPVVAEGIRAAQRAKYRAIGPHSREAKARWRAEHREHRAAYQRAWRARRKAA